MVELTKDEVYKLYSLILKWERLMKLCPLPVFVFETEEISDFIKNNNLYIGEGVNQENRENINDKKRYVLYVKSGNGKSFAILKHIRNAFAHGNIGHKGDYIYLEDKTRGKIRKTMMAQMEFSVLYEFTSILLKNRRLDFSFKLTHEGFFFSKENYSLGHVLKPHKRTALKQYEWYSVAIELKRMSENDNCIDPPYPNECTFVCPTKDNAKHWCKHIMPVKDRRGKNTNFYIYKVSFDVAPVWFTYPMESIEQGQAPALVANEYWNSKSTEIPDIQDKYIEAPISSNVTIIGRTIYEFDAKGEIIEKEDLSFENYIEEGLICNN